MIRPLIRSEEWRIMDSMGHCEVGFADNPVQVPMGLWVSRGLNWLAVPLEWSVLPDDCPLPLLGGRYVMFRRLTPEWLTWLRRDFQHRDPQSTLAIQTRMVLLRDAITVCMPELEGADVELPAGYAPPRFDAVTHSYR